MRRGRHGGDDLFIERHTDEDRPHGQTRQPPVIMPRTLAKAIAPQVNAQKGDEYNAGITLRCGGRRFTNAMRIDPQR